MAVRKFLARNHRFFINTSTSGTVDENGWLPISGITSFSLGNENSTVDASDFDN